MEGYLGPNSQPEALGLFTITITKGNSKSGMNAAPQKLEGVCAGTSVGVSVGRLGETTVGVGL